jgi:ribosomal protein S19E (S16A)
MWQLDWCTCVKHQARSSFDRLSGGFYYAVTAALKRNIQTAGRVLVRTLVAVTGYENNTLNCPKINVSALVAASQIKLGHLQWLTHKLALSFFIYIYFNRREGKLALSRARLIRYIHSKIM